MKFSFSTVREELSAWCRMWVGVHLEINRDTSLIYITKREEKVRKKYLTHGTGIPKL